MFEKSADCFCTLTDAAMDAILLENQGIGCIKEKVIQHEEDGVECGDGYDRSVSTVPPYKPLENEMPD